MAFRDDLWLQLTIGVVFLTCSQELQVIRMFPNVVFPEELNVQINEAKNK